MRRISAASDEIKIATVAAICLMALVIMLKNVVGVSASVLSRDVIIYIVVYSAFWMLPAFSIEKGAGRYSSALVWSLVIVAMTVAIIAVYAI